MRLKKLANIILSIFVWSMALVGQAAARYEAKGGIIDLSAWNPKTDGAVPLQGEWRFYWSRMDSEEELATGQLTRDPEDGLIKVAMPWTEVKPGSFGPFGYATHVLEIKGLPASLAELTMVFSQFSYMHRSYIYYPKAKILRKIAEAGRVGKSRESSVMQNLKRIATLELLGEDHIYLIQQVASYRTAGGMAVVPTLGDSTLLRQGEQFKLYQAWMVIGMFALLVISNFSLFFLRPEDKPSLVMAIFAVVMLLRFFGTEAFNTLLYPEPHEASFVFFYLVIAFALPVGMSLYLSFFSYSFRGQYPKWALVACWLLTSIFVLGAVLSFWWPAIPQIYSQVMLLQSLLGLIMFSKLIKLAIAKTRGAALSLVGVSLLMGAMANDVFVYLQFYEAPYIGHYGMIAFIFAQSLVVATHFAHAFRTAEHLSRELQSEVDRQTEKLRMQRDRLEEAQKQLVKVHDELKENDEQKTRFFRTISHELRTPLTLILGTLADSEDMSRLRRSVDIASRHAKRLYRLVNQLLDFQKVALAKISLRTERIDLETFVRSLANYVEDACKNVGVQFELAVEAEIQGGFIIRAQMDALEKILFNYFGNALKFTPKGGRIRLVLSLVGAYARVSVIDSGCGIPNDQQDKLFKLFSQIEGPQQNNKQGTGLGLALVKELAQQMQGRVGVESAINQGSTFWVEFPRVLADADRHAIVYVDSQERAFPGIRKLFAEQGLEGYLHCVSRVSEAEVLLQQYPIQILIVHAYLGDEVGKLIEIASHIRPQCWRVLFVDPTRQTEIKAFSTQGIAAMFTLPITKDFFVEAQSYLHIDIDRRHAPVLDLVYVDDDNHMHESFVKALNHLTLIERFKVVASADEYRALLKHYRIKVVICDAVLKNSELGIDLLALTQRLSPETYRILFTGETSPEILSAAIQQGCCQYIIYKPADFAKEFAHIEEVIAKSQVEPSEQTASGEAAPEQGWQLADFAALSQSVEATAEAPVAGPCKATLLIVDDVSDIRSILHDMLSAHQYRVIHADSGKRALERLQEKNATIDLVITDWVMPEMTGADLIKSMHEDEQLRSIPTVLLTAKTDEQSRSFGMKVGASAYLSKPFDQLELISVVENLLDLKRREREVSELNRFISENVLQRFLPPDLVKDLVAGKAVFDDAAKLLSVTVLFADLCDFTSSSDKLGPTRIARILNTFLVTMTDVIFAEGGTIDKFIGDAILVIFGAPTPMPNSEQISRASRCAERMQEALQKLNADWQQKEQHTFDMRIGIHHGSAIVGSFGGQKRSDYTAIGHTVNLAARIQAKAQPGEILISATVRDYVEEETWESAGNYALKGIGEEVALYRLKTRPLKKSA